MILLLALCSIASAKILVLTADLDTIDKHYIKLSIGAGFSTKYYAYVDYGQGGLERNHVVMTPQSVKRTFRSEVEVLNLFYEHGWEIKAVISEPYGGSDGGSIHTNTCYILERMNQE